jgi:quercetin dioxygenase-like cupin family protein
VGEQGSIPISEGKIVFVPANEPHCFVNTSTETIRFVCVEPVKKESNEVLKEVPKS